MALCTRFHDRVPKQRSHSNGDDDVKFLLNHWQPFGSYRNNGLGSHSRGSTWKRTFSRKLKRRRSSWSVGYGQWENRLSVSIHSGWHIESRCFLFVHRRKSDRSTLIRKTLDISHPAITTWCEEWETRYSARTIIAPCVPACRFLLSSRVHCQPIHLLTDSVTSSLCNEVGVESVARSTRIGSNRNATAACLRERDVL
jgi:hypothetical protein